VPRLRGVHETREVEEGVRGALALKVMGWTQVLFKEFVEQHHPMLQEGAAAAHVGDAGSASRPDRSRPEPSTPSFQPWSMHPEPETRKPLTRNHQPAPLGPCPSTPILEPGVSSVNHKPAHRNGEGGAEIPDTEITSFLQGAAVFYG
jgi:hypothetical protein